MHKRDKGQHLHKLSTTNFIESWKAYKIRSDDDAR